MKATLDSLFDPLLWLLPLIRLVFGTSMLSLEMIVSVLDCDATVHYILKLDKVTLYHAFKVRLFVLSVDSSNEAGGGCLALLP